MAKPLAESLQAFLQRQDQSTLVTVLLELATAHETVHARLVRMQLAGQPDKLAADFKKTLAAWRRSTRFYDYHEAGMFGRQLETWLDQVARELQPKDPLAAASLLEAFIRSDSAWFDRADDSDGVIGDAVRTACRSWLQAAACCEAPKEGWPERLLDLYMTDEYGAREELLRQANRLLDESAQRGLVTQLESRLSQVMAAANPEGGLPEGVFRLAAALSLLSESLRDPDVQVRATLSYRPNPNPLQRQAFVEAYLKADQPLGALPWLQEPWDHIEESRQYLLAEALERLGRFEESVPIRQRLFERNLSDLYFQRWLEHLSEPARAEAAAHARRLALTHDDLVASVTVLLQLGDASAAEARLIAESAGIDGADYVRLAPLTKVLRVHGCARGETVLYRALLNAILDRGYSRAYSHAARYWCRLAAIAGEGIDLQPLPSHDEFEADIRARHKRKLSFWTSVKDADGGGATATS